MVVADNNSTKKLLLQYNSPASNSMEGWEKWSLPLGCGYFGASVFGRTDTERIQLTENSLCNPYPEGLNNFAELFLDFGHDNPVHYWRGLSLNDAVASVMYESDGVIYRREYFTSYPARVMVIKISASQLGKISFRLRPVIPYLTGPAEPKGKSGSVCAAGDTVTLSGRMHYYNILFEGIFKVLPVGGHLNAGADFIDVQGSDSAVILVALGTNYQMEERVFLEPDNHKKLACYPHPHERLATIIAGASEKEFDVLLAEHKQDYKAFFNRVELDLGGYDSGETTDALLRRCSEGEFSPYLAELYFQFGRYLLISSSRKGTLPGNLQGIWNAHNCSPWSSGYWHNINIQMNYWPVFCTNLAELFESYADYHRAFIKAAEEHATEYVRKNNSPAVENGAGANGWAVGTGCWPYQIEGPSGCSHSGPGTGGLTAKLFADWYEFTCDKKLLAERIWPVLSGMSRFLSKTVKEYDGLLLADPSASPEQCVDGIYPNYYHTVGCTFDQQMIFETHHDMLREAELLGYDDASVSTAKSQLERLDPIPIGDSGQIKEYREEHKYGEIGEANHRHISQLVGLYPGSQIHSDTPELLAAAKKTLLLRGDQSTGWAMAHRLNCWARIYDGEHAHKLLTLLLTQATLPNLWNTHPPFQVDGNYGGTAGVAEMLLQSHDGYISPLPALPSIWKEGHFSGLVARGNFEIAAAWKDGQLTELEIKSRAGGICRVRYHDISQMNLLSVVGDAVVLRIESRSIVSFDTIKGNVYRFLIRDGECLR